MEKIILLRLLKLPVSRLAAVIIYFNDTSLLQMHMVLKIITQLVRNGLFNQADIFKTDKAIVIQIPSGERINLWFN